MYTGGRRKSIPLFIARRDLVTSWVVHDDSSRTPPQGGSGTRTHTHRIRERKKKKNKKKKLTGLKTRTTGNGTNARSATTTTAPPLYILTLDAAAVPQEHGGPEDGYKLKCFAPFR